jgi:dimethylamine/trimethylamine dehydrogenase
MSNSDTAASSDYLETLLSYYEDEISGEAYFYALADHFAERDKIILLAKTERVAAQAIEPLLEKYGLVPRHESDLKNEGRSYLELHQSYSWPEFMAYIVERYPAYLDEFNALEQMAPSEDLEALSILTTHEVAVIDFAEKELDGDPDSLAPLLQYLE